jgi:hypothetical protein
VTERYSEEFQKQDIDMAHLVSSLNSPVFFHCPGNSEAKSLSHGFHVIKINFQGNG